MKKEEDRKRHQDGAEDEVKAHFIERTFDEDGLVPNGCHLEVGREHGFELLQPGADRFDHSHGVHARLLAHENRDRVLAI